MEKHEDLEGWLINLIQSLVSLPEKVNISYVKDDQGILFTVKVDERDLGRIIGREGTIAKSIRVLLRSYAYLAGDERVSMKIENPNSNFVLNQNNEE